MASDLSACQASSFEQDTPRNNKTSSRTNLVCHRTKRSTRRLKRGENSCSRVRFGRGGAHLLHYGAPVNLTVGQRAGYRVCRPLVALAYPCRALWRPLRGTQNKQTCGLTSGGHYRAMRSVQSPSSEISPPSHTSAKFRWRKVASIVGFLVTAQPNTSGALPLFVSVRRRLNFVGRS